MPGACCGADLVLALSWAARGETLGSGLQGLLAAAVVLLRVRRVYLLSGGQQRRQHQSTTHSPRHA